jgi:hypothetical protein
MYFGRNDLFRDVDNRKYGIDYRDILSEQVAKCEVLLALIGDGWLNATDDNGKRRIDNPSDPLRIEIESALSRGIIIIPILVGKASLPKESDFPETLRKIHYLEHMRVRPDPDFHRDIEQLVHGICERLEIAAPNAVSRVTSSTANETHLADDERNSTLGENCRKYIDNVLKSACKDGTSTDSSARGFSATRMRALSCATIRLGVLKSGNATYVSEIERALIANLEKLKPSGVRLVPSNDFVEWADRAEWSTSVSRLLSRGGRDGFNFLVAIGTQAGVALHNSLGRKFGKPPTLLLGVTYPRVAGLVDSEYFRCENQQVACIRYGCGLDAVASLLHNRIFPGRKLCFVFQRDVPQDEAARDELATTRLVREGKLQLLPLSQPVQPEDMADRNTVYFSWYTFTRLFHEREFSILRDHLSVSIMQDNVRDGLAMVGVGTDHNWMGQRGASLIVEHFNAADDAKPNWGNIAVMLSPVVYWLNRTLAKKRGIEFSRAVLDGASEVYD